MYKTDWIDMSLIFSILVYIILFAGWIMNLFKIVNHMNDNLTMAMILRVIGVFAAPLGSIMGYF